MSDLTPKHTPDQPHQAQEVHDKDWALMVSLYPDEFSEDERSLADELICQDSEGAMLQHMLSEVRSVNDPMYCEPTDLYLGDARRARILHAAQQQLNERAVREETLLERVRAWFTPGVGYLVMAALLGVVMLNVWSDLDQQTSSFNVTPVADQVRSKPKSSADESPTNSDLKTTVNTPKTAHSAVDKKPSQSASNTEMTQGITQGAAEEVNQEGSSAPELEIKWRGRSNAQSHDRPKPQRSSARRAKRKERRARRSQAQKRTADRARRAPKRTPKRAKSIPSASDSSEVEVQWRGRGAQPKPKTEEFSTRGRRDYAPPPPSDQSRLDQPSEAPQATQPKPHQPATHHSRRAQTQVEEQTQDEVPVTDHEDTRSTVEDRIEVSDVTSSSASPAYRRRATSGATAQSTTQSRERRRAELIAMLRARTGELKTCSRLNSSAVYSLRTQVKVSSEGVISVVSALKALGARDKPLTTTSAYQACVTQKIASWRLPSRVHEALVTHTFERLTLNSSLDSSVDTY